MSELDSAHARARELGAIALDFELDPAEREELDRHLATCVQCTSHVTSLSRDAAALAELPGVDAPARIRPAVAAGRSVGTWSRTGPLVAALAVAVLTIGPLGFAALYMSGFGFTFGSGGGGVPIMTPGLPAATSVAAPTYAATPSPSPSPSMQAP